LVAAGAELDVRRLHAGDALPADLVAHDALICLGGALGAYDDEVAPWLAGTRALLARAVAESVPTLAVGLGAQLLAVATGGHVGPSDRGTDIGADLVAKRDVTELDVLFGDVPITPDVMFFRREAITALPGGSELLLAGLSGPIEAFRVGSAAWGANFHIETTAETLRRWRSAAVIDDEVHGGGPGAGSDGGGGVSAGTRAGGAAWTRSVASDDLARSERRCGPMLDEAETMMGEVWQAFAHRFVGLIRDGIPQTAMGRVGPRLPIVGSEPEQ
jgi:GMP synthase-like glutamine amidotransferase